MTEPGKPGTSSRAVLRDLMTTRVAKTRPGASVAEAAAGMVEANVGSTVVMQGTFLAGILTERDVPLLPDRPAAGSRLARSAGLHSARKVIAWTILPTGSSS